MYNDLRLLVRHYCALCSDMLITMFIHRVFFPPHVSLLHHAVCFFFCVSTLVLEKRSCRLWIWIYDNNQTWTHIGGPWKYGGVGGGMKNKTDQFKVIDGHVDSSTNGFNRGRTKKKENIPPAGWLFNIVNNQSRAQHRFILMSKEAHDIYPSVPRRGLPDPPQSRTRNKLRSAASSSSSHDNKVLSGLFSAKSLLVFMSVLSEIVPLFWPKKGALRWKECAPNDSLCLHRMTHWYKYW